MAAPRILGVSIPVHLIIFTALSAQDGQDPLEKLGKILTGTSRFTSNSETVCGRIYAAQ